ncbi:hypothetical protein C3Y93_14160 (plasmid) [Acinetobacter sp. SWBY1]|nr:hypothetical protein C3Y93_14160 [Acinetobacter sp. SWBY1]
MVFASLISSSIFLAYKRIGSVNLGQVYYQINFVFLGGITPQYKKFDIFFIFYKKWDIKKKFVEE